MKRVPVRSTCNAFMRYTVAVDRNESRCYCDGVGDFRTGNGADWLDLLATLLGRYREEQVEMLPDPDALRAWLAEHGMEPAAPVTVADVEATRSMREAMHRAATAALRGRAPDARDVRILQEALAADRPLRIA